MCTASDVKKMVYEAFEEKDGIRAEIRADTKREIRLAAFQLLAAIGVTLILAVISLTAYLTTIRNDVDNVMDLVSGPVNSRIEENEDQIRDLATKEDIRRLEATIIRLEGKLDASN